MRNALLVLTVISLGFSVLSGADVALWLWLRLYSNEYVKVELEIKHLKYSEGASDKGGSRGNLIATATYLDRPIKVALKDENVKTKIRSQNQAESSDLLGRRIELYIDKSFDFEGPFQLVQGRTLHCIESSFFESGDNLSGIVFCVSILTLVSCLLALRKISWE